MSQKTMYSAINNSPVTQTVDLISNVAVSINLESTSCLPAAPNIATIGTGDDAELILYTVKSATSISGISRGFNGTRAKSWPVGTPVYRAFTAYDHEAFRANIDDLRSNKLDSGGTAANAQKLGGLLAASYLLKNGLTVNGEAPDASGRIVVKRLYESTGESYARLRYQDAILPYIEVTGGGEYAGADFALRKEIGKKGFVCRYRESANDEYHYDSAYTTENPPPYPVTKVNNRTGEIVVDHLRRTATGFRVSLGGNEENWTLNALTQDNKNKSIVFVNSNTGAITLYYGYADDNTAHETARVYTEKAPPPSDIVAVGNQATLSVNGTITLSRSIKSARFILTRVNYIGTTGSLSGANPQVIDFAVISSTSDTVDINHAFFTLSSDGLTLTFKSGERVRLNKNTLYMSCEALASVNIGPVYAAF